MTNTPGKNPTHVAHLNNIFDTDQESVQASFNHYLGSAHSSISHIKRNSSIQCFFCGNEICLTTPNEILKLLREIDTEKTISFDMIRSKLIKIAAHVLCSPLSKAVNNSLS